MNETWIQVIAIVGSNIVLFLWSRSESRSDIRMMIEMVDGIKQEIKDFHGRLCAIEERNKNKE
jgi:hypothetical protein